MHKLPSEAATWLRNLLAELPAGAANLGAATSGPAELALLVPYTHLPGMAKLAFGSGVAIGAQDLSSHASGAYTGEVSGAMLRDAGAAYVIVGHSERRAYHHEDDATVNGKLAAAKSAGLVPILCVGESRTKRDAGDASSVVLGQLDGALDGFELSGSASLVVAYEPVWAIGTGRTATPADADRVQGLIRNDLARRGGTGRQRILYGGSVKPGNVAALLGCPNVDGVLVGGASVDVEQWAAITAAIPD